MSHHATDWAVEAGIGKGLTANAKLLLWHIADSHNPTYGCFQSQEFLARRCEMSRSTLNRAMDDLAGAGLISRERRVDAATGRQLSTRYRLAFEPGFAPEPAPARVSKEDTAEPVENPLAEAAGPVENLVARVSNEGGSVSHSYETLTSNRTTTPLPPEAGFDPAQFAALVNNWPKERLGNPGRAEEAFAALAEAERAKATTLVGDYRQGCFALKRGLPQLSAYLHDRLFLEFEDAPQIRDGLFHITPERREWRDWMGWVRKQHGEPGIERVRRQGHLLVATRWPETTARKAG